MAEARSYAQETSAAETLAGTVERVTFHNAGTGFAVLKVLKEVSGIGPMRASRIVAGWAEQAITDRLVDRAAGSPPWPAIDLGRAIHWVESRTAKTLSVSQREALRLVLASKVAVITGGPGVGKTSTLDSLLRILVAKGVQVALAAPTGRAAKRMTEQTGV
jgi:ATP-dependent exoDNAse (exonuclease V) alpha subunit